MNSASPMRADNQRALAEPLSPERLTVLRASVDHHARRLVSRVHDAGIDIDDLRQALILAAWSRIAQFDPARASWPTFVNLVVRHAAWDLAGEAFRHQRRTARSLDDPYPAVSGKALPSIDLVSVTDDADDVCSGSHDAYRAVEASVDLERAIQSLPDALRRLCRLLQLESPSTAERLSALSTAEFYRQVNEVRMRFRSIGLRPE